MERIRSETHPEEPLTPEAKWVTGGCFVSFPTKEDAREAIIRFWSKVDPDIAQRIEGSMLDPEKHQITSGMRTEFSSMPSEHRGKGYEVTVFFSGNGNPLSAQASAALIELGYLS